VAGVCLVVSWTGAATARSQAEKPFILPFKDPPGPSTWLLGQPYGNTVGAYTQRDDLYRAVQGVHFGVDFNAACGTELVAMADGVVFAVDASSFGAPPHNLMVDHPQLGYATFYGHLLRTPDLTPGQHVKAGDVVALSGDPDETCYGRPHLHLEIRDLKHVHKYNPLLLMPGDWDNLALVGPSGQPFERDLANPRKWQQLDDQPEVSIGGPILNDYARAWPPDWQATAQPVAGGGRPLAALPTSPAEQLAEAAPAQPGNQTAQPSGSGITVSNLPAPGSTTLQQLTQPGCCTRPFWAPDSSALLYIDKPEPDAQLGIWAVNRAQPDSAPSLVTTRIGYYTKDLSYLVELAKGMTTVEKLPAPLSLQGGAQESGGTRWTVPAKGRPVMFSPGRTRIAWEVIDESTPFEDRNVHVWVADLNGDQARLAITLPRGNLVGWVSDDVLLLSSRTAFDRRQVALYTLRLSDGNVSELARAERLRSPLVSPDGTWLAYFVFTQHDSAAKENGLWVVRTDGSARYQLPADLFGAYQWRDARRLLIVPFRPAATSQTFWQLDVSSLTVRQLTDPQQTTIKIANGDWAVSPDGRYVGFVASQGRDIWVLTLPE
jgi:hypothetical protein